MSSIDERILDYVKKQNMHTSSLDPDKEIKAMIAEMEAGLSGNDSSYDMIPTYIQKNDNITYGEEVIVLDAGGTNFRVCTVIIGRDHVPVISNFSTYPMPGMTEEVSRDEFFETIYSYIEPVIDRSDRIGFCFSYPAQIDPDLDCTLLFFAKEIKAPEVIGEKIGENINRTLEKHGHGRKQITILNDTIATLLAGMLNPAHSNFQNYIGFILGTGLNAGYMERNANITKVAGLDPSSSQAINIECGRYTGLPHSPIDRKFFTQTKDPDVALFEKVISGAYLGGLCTTLFKQAAEDGLFCEADRDKILKMEPFSTPEISFILEQIALPDGRRKIDFTCDTLETMRFLSMHMVDRVGFLSSLVLTAAALKEGAETSADAPLCLSINGSTVEKMHGLRIKLEYWLDKIMKDRYGIHYKILFIENAPIIGSAIAALTRQ
ncbi:MAG: hypothetical protein ACOCWH_01390 [Spirochaetota bacterium]